MSVDGLIPWLVQGPYLWFALVIGVVVSLDVFAVEVTRDYDEEWRDGRRRLWTSRMQRMSLMHAAFHSLSFLIYTISIYLVQFLAFLPIDFWDLPEDLGLGLLTLINFLVVAFIWWTYKNKVKEDHSEKSNDSDVVNRKDMKLFVNFVRIIFHKCGWGDNIRGIAVAASVAVDMLAVSALLKEVLLPHTGEVPIASLSGYLLLDLVVFAVAIFVVVAIVVFLAQVSGTLVRESKWLLLVVLLRVFEPLAVFFILAGVARHVAHLSFGSSHTDYTIYGDIGDAIFAVVVTISLFWSNGIRPLQIMQLYGRRSVDSMSTNPPVTLQELVDELKGFLPAIGVALTVFAVIFVCMLSAYSTVLGGEINNHLIETTRYIACVAFFVTIAVLYAPSKRLDDWETSATVNLHRMFHVTPRDSFNRFGAVTLALVALNIYTLLLFGRTTVSESILLWSVYLVLSWLLFDLRRCRFCKSDSAGGIRRINYAELLTAVGLASSAVAIVVPFIV